jgi:hypothetical protein
VPFRAPLNGGMCTSTLHQGRNVFHEQVRASYRICGGSSTPPCTAGRGMPGLPTGRYHTVVSLPLVTPAMPSTGELWVTVTK